MALLERFQQRKQLLSPTAPPSTSGQQRFEQKKRFVATEGQHFQYAEIRRIIGMPLAMPLEAEEAEEYNHMNVLAPAYNEGFRLFPVQAEGVFAYESYGGLFGPIPVGEGKTLTSLMIANKAWQKGLRKILLLVPPQVLRQLVERDIRWARTKVPITYPILVLGGKSLAQRRAYARSGKKGLYVLPYSCMCTKDTVEVLEGIQPELIIADEAHKLSARNTATTKRLLHYIERYKPEGVCLSGTITSKGILDYYHLIKWCLGSNNPLPNSTSLANEWAVVLDACASSGDCEYVSSTCTGPLQPLVQWANKHYPHEQISQDIAGFRKAYRLRLTSTPGVVASKESKLGTSLILANVPVPDYKAVEGWNDLENLIDNVEERWLTPNDDEIDHAIHKWKWLFELSAGFYNSLTWPEPEILAERRSISEIEASDLLEKAKVHHEAGQSYAKALRSWLAEKSKPGLDTPMLVGMEMARNGAATVGHALYGEWKAWKDLDFPGRPERDSTSVRVCPYKINEMLRWSHEEVMPTGKGAIVWYYHQEMGVWATEELREIGMDAVHCPAGDAFNSLIIDPANADKIIVASISAHGTGKNLQHFEHQYVLQWPRPAHVTEQMLGRTHRNGQKADELVVRTNWTLEFDELNFAACLNDSLYIHQTTGNRQKLIYATYDPLPKVFPSMVLQERGFQNRKLDRGQEKYLQEKFGD